MTTPIANVDNTTLNNVTVNLDIDDIADPALRKAAFQYIYTEMQTIITAYNAFVAAGGIATGNLADLSVTTAKLADLAVTTGKIPDLAIVTAKINDLAVTAGKIALGTITSAQIADLSIATGDLADALITTAKLADLNVTTGKLADASVTLAKMAAASVGTSQLVDGSVIDAKIASGTITADKFVAGALNNDTQNGLLITALQADVVQRAVNVKASPYNAKGDGITNAYADKTAIIAAQNSLPSGGGVVIIPPGNYVIFGMTLRSNVTYIGYGATLDIGPDNTSGSAGILITGLSNIKFIGFTLEGRRSQVAGVVGDGTAIGFFIRGCDNIEVIDCTFNNWYTDGITISDNAGVLSTNIRVINPTIYNSRRNGISVVHADGVLIERGKITNTTGTSPQSAIDIEPDSYACKNVIVRGVRMSGNASGNGVSITGNSTYLAENVTVQNCVSEGIERIATIGNAKGSIRIINNIGSQIQHYSFGTQYNNSLMDLFIEDNTVDGTSTVVGTQAGILIGSGRFVRVFNNVIKNSQQNAVQVDMTNVGAIQVEHNHSDNSNMVLGGHDPFQYLNIVLGILPRTRYNLATNINGATENVSYAPTYAFEEMGNSWNVRRHEYFKTPIAGTWAKGDIVYNNLAGTVPNVTGWQCDVAGTPGTWSPLSFKSKKSTTAARPTMSAIDIGYLYFDTTLVAAGKPIWWTGTAWVDATGAVV